MTTELLNDSVEGVCIHCGESVVRVPGLRSAWWMRPGEDVHRVSQCSPDYLTHYVENEDEVMEPLFNSSEGGRGVVGEPGSNRPTRGRRNVPPTPVPPSIEPLFSSTRRFRHMVRLDGNGWRCVDCGQYFNTWPPDSEGCPAHAE